MKRIVTGVNSHDRSCVVSAEDIPEDHLGQVYEVWNYRPDDVAGLIAGVADRVAAAALEPPDGGVKWVYAVIPPLSEPVEAPQIPGVDEDGFHTTRTVDFDFVVEGELTMLLDADTVRLEAGDFVIQQAARHAWRNESAAPAVLLALLHTPAR
jgi:mannose-6-phosphate isomerase-like protein (cupin superfamily)